MALPTILDESLQRIMGTSNPQTAIDLGKQLQYQGLASENAGRIGSAKTKEYLDILKANQGKDFVQRVTDPTNYPVVANPEGGYSSHRMASGELPDGTPIAFPTLFHDKVKGELYSSQNPMREAYKRNDYIKFDTPEAAEAFADNGYKVGMNINRPKIPNIDGILALIR